MVTINETTNWEEIYHYQRHFPTPYFFSQPFDIWKQSFCQDVDGQGRVLFRDLTVKAAYCGNALVGFIQYGHSAFGFGENGDISQEISYPIIRNFYFDPTQKQAGRELLRHGLKELGADARVYAYFHYFGMRCFGRHGKLFEKYSHIQEMLLENGFVLEHENVYYTSTLEESSAIQVQIDAQELSSGHQQYMDFLLDGNHVGGCKIHYVDDLTAYLRWIYVNGDQTGKGIGTLCMKALKQWLYGKGIRRLDTDTALNNTIAQHYYEKTGFLREGITRSYHTP